MISPSELGTQITAADQVILTAAERDIDATLRKDFGNKQEIWVSIDRPWTPRICNELIRRYTVAGWQVRWESDQRDGNSLVFSAKVGSAA